MSTPELSLEVVVRELRGQLAQQTRELGQVEVELRELRRRQEAQVAALCALRDWFELKRLELNTLLPAGEEVAG